MGKIDDMMKPKDIEEETWDSELPEPLGFTLTEGKHEIRITALELVNTRFADEKTGQAKKALQITGNGILRENARQSILKGVNEEIQRKEEKSRGSHGTNQESPESYLEAKKKRHSKQAPETYGITYAETNQ